MLYKIVLVGVVVCFINILIKKYFSEFVLPIEIVFLSLSVVLLIDTAGEIFGTVSEYFNEIEFGEEIFSSVIKGMGICLLTKFSADICSQNGNKLVADVIEFSGRIMLTVIALPYIESIISIALAFVK